MASNTGNFLTASNGLGASNTTPGGYNSGAGNSDLTGAGGGAGGAGNGNFITGLGTLFGVGGPGTSSGNQLLNAGYQTRPDLSAAQQWQNQQAMLAHLQTQQATGNGPSAAAAQLNAGTQQAVANQNAASAGQRYGQNAAQSAYNNAGVAAGTEGNAANNAAALKANSMQAGMQGLGETAQAGTAGALGMQGAIQAAQNPVANLYGQQEKQSSNFGQSIFSGLTNAAGGAMGLGGSGGAATGPIAGAARGGFVPGMAGGGIADGWQGGDYAAPPPIFSGAAKKNAPAPQAPAPGDEAGAGSAGSVGTSIAGMAGGGIADGWQGGAAENRRRGGIADGWQGGAAENRRRGGIADGWQGGAAENRRGGGIADGWQGGAAENRRGGGIADGWQGGDDAAFGGSAGSVGTSIAGMAGGGFSPSMLMALMAKGGVHDDRVFLGEKAPEVVAPVNGPGKAKLVTHPSLVHMGAQPKVVVPLKPGSAPYSPGPLPNKVGPPPSTPAPRHIQIDPRAQAAMAGKAPPAGAQKAVSPLSPKNAPVVRQALANGGVQPPHQLDVLMGHVRRLHAENQALRARAA